MATILVVEDDVFIRENTEWIIGDLGHEALLADDLASAQQHFASAISIDALFVDIRLATVALGGYDIANEAVAIRRDLRVLYTSGSPLSAFMSDRFVRGGQFLQKPYSYDQLEMSLGHLFATALPETTG
jgi:DNA-binding NtrC family response regulator